jgi:hypothetical protein
MQWSDVLDVFLVILGGFAGGYAGTWIRGAAPYSRRQYEREVEKRKETPKQ